MSIHKNQKYIVVIPKTFAPSVCIELVSGENTRCLLEQPWLLTAEAASSDSTAAPELTDRQTDVSRWLTYCSWLSDADRVCIFKKYILNIYF